jgi:hypothetical protein
MAGSFDSQTVKAGSGAEARHRGLERLLGPRLAVLGRGSGLVEPRDERGQRVDAGDEGALDGIAEQVLVRRRRPRARLVGFEVAVGGKRRGQA